LLDNTRLVAQLAALERRNVRGSGKIVIDHPIGPNYHDDLGNVYAGVCAAVTRRSGGASTGWYHGLGTLSAGSRWPIDRRISTGSGPYRPTQPGPNLPRAFRGGP
jgi:hypothetical protein